MDVTVKKSNIHGQGVFANKNFKKGDTVIAYSLKKLSREEFDALPESEKHFTSKEGNGYLLFSSPERFVNHSCEPNVFPSLAERRDKALRAIKKGEEIVADYAFEDVPGLNMSCNCGSKNCRKIIRSR